jgi:ferritin-like metal-binding protein YciE
MKLLDSFENDFKDIEVEEEGIIKEFEKMEQFLNNLDGKNKITNRVQETKNITPEGGIVKSVIKSLPEKKARKSFNGCKIQHKTIILEKEGNENENDEYLEIKKVFKQCPKTKKIEK